jgi:hypothetical protein
MVNALLATGIAIPSPEGTQPEDLLASVLDAPEAWECLARDFPEMKGKKPREVHALLSWAVNERFVGRAVTTFSPRVDLREIFFRIVRHKAASVVTGRFTPGGHLVSIVGLESDQGDIENAPSPATINLKAIRSVLVHDSWGDWHGAYREGRSGYEVPFTLTEIMSLTREFESERKWAHLFDINGVF